MPDIFAAIVLGPPSGPPPAGPVPEIAVYEKGIPAVGVSVAPAVPSSYVYQKPIRPPQVMIAPPVPVMLSTRVPGAAQGVAVPPLLLDPLLATVPLLELLLVAVVPLLLELVLVVDPLLEPAPLVPPPLEVPPPLPVASSPKSVPPPSSLPNPVLDGEDAQPCTPAKATAPKAMAGRSIKRAENMGNLPCIFARGTCPGSPIDACARTGRLSKHARSRSRSAGGRVWL
jgi:hypothetical protein